MRCNRCTGEQFTKAGHDRFGRQIVRCTACRRRLTERSNSAFRSFNFPDEIIALAVRYYLQFRLPYADVVTLLAERGIVVDRSTVFDWVQRFALLFEEVARPYRHLVGRRWSVDETYVRVAGVWRYVYRAIDEEGQVIDVFLSTYRDAAAATSFFRQAMERTNRRPQVVTTDKAACYPSALRLVLPEATPLTGKILQQRIERDHGHLKSRLRSMRWFKTDRSAARFCRAHAFFRNLRQGFYAFGLSGSEPGMSTDQRLPQMWDTLTAALRAA